MDPFLLGGIVVKKALITGITGQDGSYLAELLLHKGYEAYDLFRRSICIRENMQHDRADHL